VTDAFILGGVRTPEGRYGGTLSDFRTSRIHVPSLTPKEALANCA
jgi:hypothetical protein